jgi:predicted NACHT family NTPase
LALDKLERKANLHKPQIILTTRAEGPLTLPTAFKSLRILPFDDRQLVSFFHKWCERSDQDQNEILSFLTANPHVKEICRTPMTATIVAALHENQYELPASRTEVYEKRFGLLLEKWDRIRKVPKRTRVTATDKLRFLTRLALALHRGHRQRFSAKEASKVWRSGFEGLYPGIRIQDLLTELQLVDNVIVTEGKNEFSLGHLSYQEYLAARGIVLGQRVHILAENFSDPWWRQTLIFYAGIAGDVGRLFDLVQRRSALSDPHGLLEEMIAEARYTPTVVRELIADFHQEGLLGDEEDFVVEE